jgi:acetoin utilization protein AcuB
MGGPCCLRSIDLVGDDSEEQTMLVSEIMTAKPITLHQDQTLRAALEIMETHMFHSEGQLVGIVNKHDCRAALKTPSLVRSSWQTQEQIIRLPIRTIMTPAPIVVEPEADADDAVRLMLTHHVSCLPVVRSETLVGIVTTSDIMVAFRTLYRRVRQYHNDY